MRLRRLLLRSLVFHIRSHVGVALGVAVATAVLVGALAVGDSLQASLRRKALSRLGNIVAAYDGHDRFFVADPGGPTIPTGGNPIDPDGWITSSALVLPGLATRQDGTARANRIRVIGIDTNFMRLAPKPAGGDLQSDGVWLNTALASQLKAKAGDGLVLRLHKPGALSLDAIISPRDEASVALRVTVSGILGDDALGGFDLGVGQETALNAFVPQSVLQSLTGLDGRANVLVAGRDPGQFPAEATEAAVTVLDGAMARHATLADLEYAVRSPVRNAAQSGGEAPPSSVELATRRIFIEEPAAVAALGLPPQPTVQRAVPIATYLVNRIDGPTNFVPYSMVTAAGPPYTPADLGENEIVINQWLASDLGVGAGGEVRLAFYEADSAARLVERTNTFRVRSVVPMRGLWADRTLMPEFPGLSKAESTHDWDAGFELVHKIRDQDEAYWKQWRGTPKAFISEAAGRRLWANRFGQLTAIRWFPAEGTDLAAETQRIAGGIRSRLEPTALGMTLRPVRKEALAAVQAGTAKMFGGLFIGCSLFIIASALMLTSLLFRFGLEQRAGEVGILLALGWPARRLRNLHLIEGTALAVVGAIPGAALGTAYAQAIVWGLNHAWSDAVAGLQLQYEITPIALVAGTLAGVLVAVLTLYVSLRHLARRPARELLNEGSGGLLESGRGGKPARWLRPVPFLLLATAAGLVAFAFTLSDAQKPGAFFGAGILVLTSGIMALRRRFMAPVPVASGLSRSTFVWRAPGRQPTRSAATVTLLAAATFLVAALAVFRLEARRDASRRAGGTGGFIYWGEAALPILKDLNTDRGLEEYGLSRSQVEGVSFVALRVRDGDDASCLNLSRAARPRILGVDPQALAGRGSFSFAGLAKGISVTNGWLALRTAAAPDEIPAVADTASLQWALQKRVGDTLDITDEKGRTLRLRFVGAVAQGILQGNILIDEETFTRLFPSESGHRVLLVDAPAERAEKVRADLTRALEDTGLALTSTVERLDRFNSVQNTYLGTFQVLGGLGLLLGSIGLGIVVLRNVHERRGELAVLRALGFERAQVRRLLLLEHVTLVVLGLGLGCVAAAVAVTPLIAPGGTGLPWRTLVPTLVAVGVNGLVFTWAATRYASRGIVIDALRGE